MKYKSLKALLLATTLASSSSAMAGNLLDWFSFPYFGVSKSLSSGLGSTDAGDRIVGEPAQNSSDLGLILGTAWFDRFSTEFRILNLAAYSESLDQQLSERGSEETALSEVSALYYFRESGPLDSPDKRKSVSPFVRLGLGSINGESIEFGLNTSGKDYLTVGMGVDLTAGGIAGLRAEALALHDDFLFATLSLFIKFD